MAPMSSPKLTVHSPNAAMTSNVATGTRKVIHVQRKLIQRHQQHSLEKHDQEHGQHVTGHDLCAGNGRGQ